MKLGDEDTNTVEFSRSKFPNDTFIVKAKEILVPMMVPRIMLTAKVRKYVMTKG